MFKLVCLFLKGLILIFVDVREPFKVIRIVGSLESF